MRWSEEWSEVRMGQDVLRPLLLLLLLSQPLAGARFGENYYISEKMNWSDATSYCSLHFTGMSSVDFLQAVKRNGGSISEMVSPDLKTWAGQSAAVNASSPSASGLSCPAHDHSVYAESCERKLPFYCLDSRLDFVKESKTWEEALDHCRSLGKELVSLPSQDALPEVLEASASAGVQSSPLWTGLRFLADRWMWVNGSSAQAAGLEDVSPCPRWSDHCGALSLQEGHLKSWDCDAKLRFICY